VGVGPGAGDQPPVPAQQRLRPNEEARPAGPGQHAADGGEHRTVGRFEPRSWGLAAQHGQLVTEHQDLQVLASIAAGQQHEQLDGAAQGQVGEVRSTARSGPSRRSAETPHYRATKGANCQLTGLNRVCAPYATAQMFEELLAYDAWRLGTRFEVPFFLFQGESDVVTLIHEYIQVA
jgi:hypothetical protein